MMYLQDALHGGVKDRLVLPEEHVHVFVVGVVRDDDVKFCPTKFDEDLVEGGGGQLGYLAPSHDHQMLVHKLKKYIGKLLLSIY